MAVTLAQIGNAILTSVWGRRLGMDPQGRLQGFTGMREPVEDISTTAASSLTPYGVSRLMSTNTSTSTVTYTLQGMAVGAYKRIVQTSSSTGGFVVLASTGYLSTQQYFISSATTSTGMSLKGTGGVLHLQAITTALISVLGQNTAVTTA